MSESNESQKPGKLPPMTMEEIEARAQRILNHRGEPPYTNLTSPIQDEIDIVNEFMHYWRPFLVRKA
jgi:hypothetical protein